jgi:hypothetical protein
MPRTKIARAVRLSPDTIARAERIRSAREGLSFTRVVENAIELYHRQVIGRSAPPADEVAVRTRQRDVAREPHSPAPDQAASLGSA